MGIVTVDPNQIQFSLDDGNLIVMDMGWNRLDEEQPVQFRTECGDWNIVTLKEIEEQYREKSGGRLIVVYETYLDGAVYRLGNYTDGKWYKIGELYGFA